MYIAFNQINHARSIGARCLRQAHVAPNGANQLCGGSGLETFCSSGAEAGEPNTLLRFNGFRWFRYVNAKQLSQLIAAESHSQIPLYFSQGRSASVGP